MIKKSLRVLLGGLLIGLAVNSCSATTPPPSKNPDQTTPTPGATNPVQGSVEHKPLVITKGGRYSGNWSSNDADVPAVTIKTSEPVIIENSVLRGRGYLIRGFRVNLEVINTKGYGLNPMKEGRIPQRFISVEEVMSLNVRNNYTEGTSGIYLNQFWGDKKAKNTIKVIGNQFRNIDGRYVDASGKITGKRYLVQAVQLANVPGVENVEVAWNEVINEPGKSAVEENINLYQGSGTSTSPILIHDNYIQGAYAVDPYNDAKYAGGGIMVGDGQQTSLDIAGGHVKVYRNQVVNTSNQGIAISGGHDQQVFDNRVLSSGRFQADQVKIPSSNVGIYMWDMQNGAKHGTFFNNVITNNLIGWMGAVSDQKFSNLWIPSCTKANTSNCEGNHDWPTKVTTATEQQEYTLWLKKLADNGIKIGPK